MVPLKPLPVAYALAGVGASARFPVAAKAGYVGTPAQRGVEGRFGFWAHRPRGLHAGAGVGRLGAVSEPGEV